MNTTAIVQELKNNQEDFEFYPSTEEMVKTIYDDVRDTGSWLDIGCGAGHFKKFYRKFYEQESAKKAVCDRLYAENDYDSKYCYKGKPHDINKYYVIEKADTFMKILDTETICIGRDFFATELYDKQVDYLFCNPPYSEYDLWAERIILEGNFRTAYLIIPQRWKENAKIQEALRITQLYAHVVGSFSFMNAERSARANVDIIRIIRDRVGGIRTDAFNRFFDSFYSFKPEKRYSQLNKEEQEFKQKMSLVPAKDKLKVICENYDAEFLKLSQHFNAIAEMDSDVLKTIGVEKQKVAEALLKQKDGLKAKYWGIVFDSLEEITDRLTTTTCHKLFEEFRNIYKVAFTPETIMPIVLWLIKNANKYYDEQLLNFYDNLTEPDNIRNYKSNIKVFKRNKYYPERFDDENELTHYTLNYRVVCSKTLFYDRSNYYYKGTDHQRIMRNIATIARNLGFEVDMYSIEDKTDLVRGTKYNVLMNDGAILFEYKFFDNGNKHIKFNTELMKAINVEVGRLRNWIQTVADIENEFEPTMAKGADKYFKVNYACIGQRLPLMLTQRAEV